MLARLEGQLGGSRRPCYAPPDAPDSRDGPTLAVKHLGFEARCQGTPAGSTRGAGKRPLGGVRSRPPDREYSRKGHTRCLFLRRPAGPFAVYEKEDFLAPNGELVAVIEALLQGWGGHLPFERYRQNTACVRDMVVCTHGSRDVCCGKFGHPVYDTLRRRYDAARWKVRVWRSSHIGGHRFVPTLIDYPEAR